MYLNYYRIDIKDMLIGLFFFFFFFFFFFNRVFNFCYFL